MMKKYEFLGACFWLSCLLPACASPTLTLLSNEKANISLVDYDDQAGEGELIGETPLSIEADRLKRQYIRAWGEGLHPQYWIVRPIDDSKTEITLRLDRKEEVEQVEQGVKAQEINKAFRMLMRAYKALTAKDLESAREIAKQLSQLQGEAAAPHIITGLSYLIEGNKAKARGAFLKAKNLDPEDRDIEELLRMSAP